MADLLASIFGGGAQTAPDYKTYDPQSSVKSFLGQDFAGEQAASDATTKNTSAANLSTFLTGLNSVDAGVVQGISAEQNLGNTLLSGSASALPAWAKTYLDNGKMQGNENAQARGVGAFSDNGLSGVNQFQGTNALNLVNMGAQLSGQASQQASGIVGSTMYKNDPTNDMLTIPALNQIGEYNNSILNQQADADAAVNNWNSNNSPLGSMIRTAGQTVVYLAGSFLGSAGKGMAM